ncbi:MAG: DNA-processing protein DprA [Sulfurovaceae bacterium]
MSQIISEKISELESMASYPKNIYYKGNISLLKRLKVSIVGSRIPSAYTKQYTYSLAQALSKRGVCVVSGGAMGVDAIAHEGAGVDNTIAVLASGIDIYYPAVNKGLIKSIEQYGMLISQFEPNFAATNWSFVLRNELVVALGEVLIVTQAANDSGSMRSVQYAQKMGKKIFVLPHRVGESEGTNRLLQDGKASIITDIEGFAASYGKAPQDSSINKDDFFYFCQQNPILDDAVSKFGERVYEAELCGQIIISEGRIKLI